MTLASLKIEHSQLALGMSIPRQCILCSAYNQIISRGYQELSSHFVNYVLHLAEPHTDRKKARLKMSHKKNSQIFYSLSFPPLLSPPSHIRPTPKLNIETKYQNANLKIPKVIINKSFERGTQNLNARPKFTGAATWKTGSGAHLNVLSDVLVRIAALSSFHATAQEKQILRLTPEPWLFLPLIVRLDPGYRNGKRSTNIKLALNSSEFFFLSLSLKGEKKQKLHMASFSWPTTNSIKLQKQCFEMLEDADRKLKKDFTQKLKTSFSEGGL